MKHLCPRCGRFIRWALMFCVVCNDVLREGGGVVPDEDGFVTYPPYQAE